MRSYSSPDKFKVIAVRLFLRNPAEERESLPCSLRFSLILFVWKLWKWQELNFYKSVFRHKFSFACELWLGLGLYFLFGQSLNKKIKYSSNLSKYRIYLFATTLYENKEMRAH